MLEQLITIISRGEALHSTEGNCAGISLRVKKNSKIFITARYNACEPRARTLGWAYDGKVVMIANAENESTVHVLVHNIDGLTNQFAMFSRKYSNIEEVSIYDLLEMVRPEDGRLYENTRTFGIVGDHHILPIKYIVRCESGNSGWLPGTILREVHSMCSYGFWQEAPLRILGQDDRIVVTEKNPDPSDFYRRGMLLWQDNGTTYSLIGSPNPVYQNEHALVLQCPGKRSNQFFVYHEGIETARHLIGGEGYSHEMYGYETDPVAAALTDFREVISQTAKKMYRALAQQKKERTRRGGYQYEYTGPALFLTPRHSKLAGNCARGTYRFMQRWVGAPAANMDTVSWDNFPVPIEKQYRLSCKQIVAAAAENRDFRNLLGNHLSEEGNKYAVIKSILRHARKNGL